jgi:hypothetical protein
MAAASVNFGPFKGVGMAADHKDEMQKIGLQPLAPRFVLTAFQRFGYGDRQIRVGLQLSQFRAVNTAKGRWLFLDHALEVKSAFTLHVTLTSAPLNCKVEFSVPNWVS